MKAVCYRSGKYTVCRRVRAPFSPETLQAGAVKGLINYTLCYKQVHTQTKSNKPLNPTKKREKKN